jgi:hypothetical protein
MSNPIESGKRAWLWPVVGLLGCFSLLCCVAFAGTLYYFVSGIGDSASILQGDPPTRMPSTVQAQQGVTRTPTATRRPTQTPSQDVALDIPAVGDDIDAHNFVAVETELQAGKGQNSSERPRVGSSVLTVENYRFRVYYTLTGKNAISDTDDNQNGFPDYPEEVLLALEYSAQLLSAWGWTLPPDDGKKGGDQRYDVYIVDLDNDDESAHVSNERAIGDNPNSTAIETRAYTSHMAIDNNLSDVDPDAPYDGLGYLRSTVAHEWLHAVQMGYDGDEPANWLWEASSTWVQDEVYPDVNDGNDYLSAVFDSPDTCLLAEGGTERTEDDTHWYGSWIFLRFLSERYGRGIIREFWEASRDLDNNAVLETVLTKHGSNLNTLHTDFAVALLLRDFQEGADYQTVRLQDTLKPGKTEISDGVGQLAMDYFELPNDQGPIKVSLSPSGLSGWWVGVQDNTATVYPDSSAFDPSQFSHSYLIIHNNNQADTLEDCAFMPYTINIATDKQSSIEAPVNIRELAVSFAPPQLASLGDFESETTVDYEDTPSDLIPANIPTDYELAGSYTITRDDIESDNINWYLPQASEGTVVDFTGKDEDHYITITVSNHDYADLQAWLDEIEYEPAADEQNTITEQTVLIENFSDENGDFFSATFLRGDQFIVVDGSISKSELRQIVAYLIAQAP